MAPPARSDESRPLVVIVDEDEAVRAALKFDLELEGYRVETCATAEALLGLELPPDHLCLVVDDRLPGVPGIRLIDELRWRGVAAPLIVITSNPNRDLRAAAAAVGASIIEKPLLNGALQAAIRKALAI